MERKRSKSRKILRKEEKERKIWPPILIEVGFAITLAASLLIIISLSSFPAIINALKYMNVTPGLINYLLLLNYIGLAASILGLIFGALTAKYKKKAYAVISMILGMFTIPASVGGYIAGIVLILIGGVAELLY